MSINPEFFKQFSLVIASQTQLDSLNNLSDFLWKQEIPLIIVQTAGFFGYLRIAIAELTSIETHQDNQPDVRLDCPFEELSDYVDSFDFNKMESIELSHVPYIVILIKALQEWRIRHTSQRVPQTTEQKAEFKDIIKSWLYDSKLDDPENFNEALKFSHKAFNETAIPTAISDLIKLNPQNDKPFWIMVSALERFCNQYNCLPLPGKIDDMKADTVSFVKLQTM